MKNEPTIVTMKKKNRQWNESRIFNSIILFERSAGGGTACHVALLFYKRNRLNENWSQY